MTSALASLQTESSNQSSFDIDVVSTAEMCRIINDADNVVVPAVRDCIEDIVPVVDEIARRLRLNGRVVYIGAGTSGRLGILDASEIPPTFSAPPDLFIGLMAGGDGAIRDAVEGAEDSLTQVVDDLKAIHPPLRSVDTLIGIAASGRTPYALSGLAHARDVLGMFTVGCVVGPEIVTGSTRMKAGTATKLILNMISTGAMIRIGKTYRNMMVDLKTSNLKLVDRSRRIFRTLLPNVALSDSEIDRLMLSCGGSVKLAMVVARAGCSVEEGRAKLDAAEGVLKRVWESETTSKTNVTQRSSNDASNDPELLLCVDAGGTKCSIAIADRHGLVATTVGGTCNFVTENHAYSLSLMKDIINRALDMVPKTHSSRRNGTLVLPSNRPLFVSAWIGAAGLDRESELKAIRPKISELLAVPDPSKLHITNDGALLSAGISPRASESSIPIDTGIVLITGTGSLACGYRCLPNNDSPIPVPIDRSGGWGYLLGDEASAYHVGKTAVQKALHARDLGLPPTPLHKAIVEHLGSASVVEILSSIYRSPHPILPSTNSNTSPKSRIASLCPVVLKLAFPGRGSKQDPEALAITRESAASAVELVLPLVRANGLITASKSVLILGGALAQIEEYRELIVDALSNRGQRFARVEVVEDAASHAIGHLVRCYLHGCR